MKQCLSYRYKEAVILLGIFFVIRIQISANVESVTNEIPWNDPYGENRKQIKSVKIMQLRYETNEPCRQFLLQLAMLLNFDSE